MGYKINDIVFDISSHPSSFDDDSRSGIIVRVITSFPRTMYVVQFSTDIGTYGTIRFPHEIVPYPLNKFFSRLYGYEASNHS